VNSLLPAAGEFVAVKEEEVVMFDLMVPRGSRRSAVPAQRDVRSIDALFDDIWRGFGAAPAARGALPGFSPRIDVRETDGEYVVTAELPGLEEKDFEVSLEDDLLTIKGEKRTSHEEEREGLRHVETRSGAFQRQLRLPTPVEADAVKASFKSGVLTVTVRKPEEAKPALRTIPVSTN
jgi:HSP20 family protein